MVAHAFNPSRGLQKQVDLYQSKASLVYKVSSSGIAQAIQRIPVSIKIRKRKKNEEAVCLSHLCKKVSYLAAL